MPKHSLRKKKDFDQVFKAGQSFYCPIFTLKYIKTAEENGRLGVIIGTKVSKKAVVRNKIKRWVRESYKQFFQKTDSYDIVVIINKEIVGLEFEDIKKQLIIFFDKIK